jgi:hypothetical protein
MAINHTSDWREEFWIFGLVRRPRNGGQAGKTPFSLQLRRELMQETASASVLMSPKRDGDFWRLVIDGFNQ